MIKSEILITTGTVWPVSFDKWKAPYGAGYPPCMELLVTSLFYSLQSSQVKRTLKVPLMNLLFEHYVSNLCHLRTVPRSDNWTA